MHLAGIKLGNYRLRRVLGRGNMGVVYLATDEALLRPTAVKVLTWSPAEHDPEAWFLAEARNVDAREDLREEHKDKSFTSITLGGENTRGPWKFDYDLAYGFDEVVEPNRLWQFRSVTANTAVDFNMQPLLFTAEPRDLAVSNLGFRQYQEQDENAR